MPDTPELGPESLRDWVLGSRADGDVGMAHADAWKRDRNALQTEREVGRLTLEANQRISAEKAALRLELDLASTAIARMAVGRSPTDGWVRKGDTADLRAVLEELEEDLIRAIAKKKERGAMSVIDPVPDSADYWQGKADALRYVRAALAAAIERLERK